MRKKFYKLILCCLFFCLGALVANGQERRVTGVVTDQEGITLPGVTIAVKGTSTRTVTDARGKFSITLEDLWGLTYDYKLKVRNRMKVLCMSISLDAGG